MARKLDTYEQWVKDGEADEVLAIIQSLAMQGHTIETIAKEIGVGERTLYTLKNKHEAVSAVLKKGRNAVVALLQSKLLDKVSEGDTGAIIYGLKIYGGDFFLKDRMTVSAELTGKAGGPIDVSTTPQIYLPRKDEGDDA